MYVISFETCQAATLSPRFHMKGLRVVISRGEAYEGLE